MKPDMPAQNFRPEHVAISHESGPIYNPELSNGKIDHKEAIENKEQVDVKNTSIVDMDLTTILPTPVDDNIIVDNVTTNNDNPLVAADDDLIEMEWVKKAKKIIADTIDNPHQREEEVNKLQADYIKKRYGKDLGSAE